MSRYYVIILDEAQKRNENVDVLRGWLKNTLTSTSVAIFAGVRSALVDAILQCTSLGFSREKKR